MVKFFYYKSEFFASMEAVSEVSSNNTLTGVRSQDVSAAQLEDSSPLQLMFFRLVAQDGPHFRHQTRDEPPLTDEEKIKIVSDLFLKNPGQFLARYSSFLVWPDDAGCFDQHLDDFTVQFYLRKAGVKFCAADNLPAKPVIAPDDNALGKKRCRIKNRRYKAMMRMKAEADEDPTNGYFSHEQMRERDPELWEDMVGRYASAEKRRALLGHQYDSFSGMLLSQILDSEMARPPVFETDEESSESSATVDSRRVISKPKYRRTKREEERQCSETEFSEIMHSRFLSGLDKDFDYAAVDNDESLDDDPDLNRDAEESYFDAESPKSIRLDDGDDDEQEQEQEEMQRWEASVSGS
uniref:CCD97-like C-terminal domain-containing protein n=1 Tax=Schistocephalus solidus TaxID=70667 RepID=A0A0X3PY20_SCHSO